MRIVHGFACLDVDDLPTWHAANALGEDVVLDIHQDETFAGQTEAQVSKLQTARCIGAYLRAIPLYQPKSLPDDKLYHCPSSQLEYIQRTRTNPRTDRVGHARGGETLQHGLVLDFSVFVDNAATEGESEAPLVHGSVMFRRSCSRSTLAFAFLAYSRVSRLLLTLGGLRRRGR